VDTWLCRMKGNGCRILLHCGLNVKKKQVEVQGIIIQSHFKLSGCVEVKSLARGANCEPIVHTAASEWTWNKLKDCHTIINPSHN
jgi:hypothetical protein